jgi:regulator of RNase E activity RraA
MVERDTPIECAGVRVRSGDIVFGVPMASS